MYREMYKGIIWAIKPLVFGCVLGLAGVFMLGCDNGSETPAPRSLKKKRFDNLEAPAMTDTSGGAPIDTGPFTYFSFSKGDTVIGGNVGRGGDVVTERNKWDIAFRATTIIVNGGQAGSGEPVRTGMGGAYVVEGLFDEVKTIDRVRLVGDRSDSYAISEGAGNGWYAYAGPPTHLITPLPGRVLVFRTEDGKYAKVEILSYYENAPSNPNANSKARVYTFNYVYIDEEGRETF